MSSSRHSLTEQGISACRSGEYQRGRLLLETAVAAVGTKAGLPPRVLAWYGLALASTDRKRMSDAIGLCESAVRREFVDAEVFHALARIYLLAGWRKKAVGALEEGLRIDPDAAELILLRSRMGIRQRPILSSLDRSHPVNIMLGKLRWGLAHGFGSKSR